jgi:hypothetical protein
MNRARARLAELLQLQVEEDFGTDRVVQAALTVESTGNVGLGQASHALAGPF